MKSNIVSVVPKLDVLNHPLNVKSLKLLQFSVGIVASSLGSNKRQLLLLIYWYRPPLFVKVLLLPELSVINDADGLNL